MSLTSNLVNYWKLNGNSFDFVGGFSGADTSVAYAQQYGYIGQGAAFNGATSKIVCSSLTSIRSQSAISFSYWFYCGWIGGQQVHLAQFDSASHNLFRIQQNTASLRFYIMNAITDGGTNYVDAPASILSLGRWYHVACVFDGSLTGSTNRARIYLNSVLQSTTATGTIPATTTAGTSPFFIGNMSSGSVVTNGYIDEVAVYTRALSQTDIDSLYNSGSGTTYPFDGSIVPTAQTIQLCDWMLNSNYYRFSTARQNAITAIRTAALAGSSVTEHDWNQFIYIATPIISPYQLNTALVS